MLKSSFNSIAKATKTIVIVIVILNLAAINIAAQSNGKYLGKIPFKLDRNKMIIEAVAGRSPKLNVIFDTGMPIRGLYLFHRELLDKIDLPKKIEVRVPGAGSGEASTAIMADSMAFKVGDYIFENQMIIIAQSEHTQKFPTDGVIGSTLYSDYALEIDYDNGYFYLYAPGTTDPDSTWTEIPMEIRQNVPFIDIEISIDGRDSVLLSSYIDIAAGEALELMVKPDQKFTMPENLSDEKYLGTGLSGDFSGKTAYIAWMKIGPYKLRNVASTFPDYEARSKKEGADAVVCDNAMRRFNLIMDFNDEKLYIRPNHSFSEPFEFPD